jgi:DNA-binding response OmpR family regulator
MQVQSRSAPRGRILFVEDDPFIRESTASGLTRAGFRVWTEGDGAAGLATFRPTPIDLVILDILLPGLDGCELCRRIRAESTVPIIMLTCKDDTADVVAALEAGADDYMIKPFKMAELVARCGAALRRASEPPFTHVLTVGDFQIEPEAFRVRKGAEELSLTPTEFNLFVELASHGGRVLSRTALLNCVWGDDYLGDSKMVDMAVARLRRKMTDMDADPNLIETVRGFGYRLRVEAAG